MSKIDEATLGYYLNKLMQDKLGKYRFWNIPTIENVIGPSVPTAFDKFNSYRSDVVKRCEEKLRKFTDDEILVLFHHKMDDPTEASQEWHVFMRREITQLHDYEPAWFVGGFGHPRYVADFGYWAKMPRFSIEELVCLSVGVEPEHFNAEALNRICETKRCDLLLPLQFLVKIYKLIKRQFDPMSVDRSASPREYLSWTESVHFDAHPEFLERLRQFHRGEKEGGPDGPLPKRPDQREVDKIAQLFTAISIDCLGYDPKAAKGPVPKEIADLAAGMGLQVSDDTVRKYLKRGAKFIPDDWNLE